MAHLNVFLLLSASLPLCWLRILETEKYLSPSGHCFEKMNQMRDFSESRDTCISHEGKLPTLPSDETMIDKELDFFSNQFGSIYYLGYTRSNPTAEYIDLVGQVMPQTNRWGPRNHSEHLLCVMLFRNNLYDTNCGLDVANVVCEITGSPCDGNSESYMPGYQPGEHFVCKKSRNETNAVCQCDGTWKGSSSCEEEPVADRDASVRIVPFSLWNVVSWIVVIYMEDLKAS